VSKIKQGKIEINFTIYYISLIDTTMELAKDVKNKKCCDVSFGKDIEPINREGCVGKNNGIDKTYTFEQVMRLAYKMDDKPNIIVRAGKKAKWYMKKCPLNTIDEKIEKQQWRQKDRDQLKYYDMWIIEWWD
jgi:hypothetical protein